MIMPPVQELRRRLDVTMRQRRRMKEKSLSVLLSSSLSSLFTKYLKSLCHILSHHCFPSPYGVLFLDQRRASDLHVASRHPAHCTGFLSQGVLECKARLKLYFFITKSHLFLENLIKNSDVSGLNLRQEKTLLLNITGNCGSQAPLQTKSSPTPIQ